MKQLLFSVFFSMFTSIGVFAQSDTTFVQFPLDFPELSQVSTIQWADLNNDNTLDVIVGGTTFTDSAYLSILLNDGDSQFVTLTDRLPLVNNAKIAIADYNHDELLDVFIMGSGQNNQRISTLWLNQTQDSLQFTASTDTLMWLSQSAVLTADFDKNGAIDLFMTGVDTAGNYQAVFYQNYRDSLTLVDSVVVPALADADLAYLDYNGDGFKDIVMSGTDSTGAIVTLLLQNDGAFTFSPIALGSVALAGGEISIGDVNHDGIADIVLSGSDVDGNYHTLIYENDGTSFITDTLNHQLANELLVADMDKDGLVDIFFAGIDTTDEYQTTIYQKNPNITSDTNYVALDTLLPAIPNAGLGDFNQDGDLDVLLISTVLGDTLSGLYINNFEGENRAPFAPTNAFAIAVHGKTFFTWASATDDHTPKEALTHSIFIGEDVRNTDWVSPYFAIEHGNRKAPVHGNVGHANSYILDELIDGRIEWGVQGVDNSLTTPVRASSGICSGNVLFSCVDITLKDTLICRNEAIELSTGGGTGLWFSSVRGYLGQHTTLSYPITQTDTVFFVVPNDLSCDDAVSWAIDFHEDTDFSPFQNDTLTACGGEELSLSIPDNGASIAWYSETQGLLSNNATFTFNATATDRIWVETSNVNGCPVSDTLVIEIMDRLDMLQLFEDQSVCPGETLSFTVPNGFTNPEWHSSSQGLVSDSTTLVWTANSSDQLWLEATNANGCTAVDTFDINVFEVIVTHCPDVSIPLGDMTTLCADGGVGASYTWSPSGSLDDATSATPSAQPLENTIYTVTVITTDGCEEIEEIEVTVTDPSFRNFTPNLFTPNEDGKNELFKVYGLGYIETVSFKIYDRQGNLVFEANDTESIQEGWDGTKGGSLLPNGTYLWQLSGTYVNGDPISVDGINSGYIKLLK